MKVVIRTDASIDIGSGHVYRCLTLARCMADRGCAVTFVCRPLPGHLVELIQAKGFAVHLLPETARRADGDSKAGSYERWLGVTRDIDAAQTAEALAGRGDIDWLIVDHYALDADWETRMRQQADKIMVIDDLPARPHDCDLLLNQNLGALEGIDVSAGCHYLLGPHYALLRPEFLTAREKHRRPAGEVSRLFVFLGGADKDNLTGVVLEGIASSRLSQSHIDIVLGKANRHGEKIASLCRRLPKSRVHCDLPELAELMVTADLAVGGAGTTTWERCCLGLPSLLIILADNQADIGKEVDRQGLGRTLGRAENITPDIVARTLEQLADDPGRREQMSRRAMNAVDGRGTARVADFLFHHAHAEVTG